jgi:hypothetical protein
MYDLHNLGWHSFQQLCLTITREILGQTVQSFLDSSDAGQDGAFTGVWNPSPARELSGRFVIQCKFTSKRDKNLAAVDITDELTKAQRLVEKGRCDCYILLTNAGLSGSIEVELEQLFKGVGVKEFLGFGSTWVCQTIQENKRLRMLVPRLYGLGDLSQILDERAYQQAKALLASLKDDLSKVVLTESYRRAAQALDRHGFVLLVGEPAAGKTTIASMLAIAALDQWGASTLKLDTPQKVIAHWNPDEPSQFFWIDDAFGVMQYESYLVHGWNHVFPQAQTMLRKGAKIVMTTRDYIYKRARKDMKESAFPLLRESQVVIDVHELSIDERRQILYNHIKLGRQPTSFRQSIKPYLESIATHHRFIPETARRLGDPLFTQGLELFPAEISNFVERQEDFLQEVLSGLDEHSTAALALIYMRNNSVTSPIELEESEREAIERLGSSIGGCIAALEALNGSLAHYVQTKGGAIWRFKHPTVGDAFAGLLLQHPELLGIYVHGSSIEKLMDQITCGDVGLEHAVNVPQNLFGLIVNRLDEFSTTATHSETSWEDAWRVRRRLNDFLSSRCSKEFLSLYIAKHPHLLDRVAQPGLFLSAVPEVDLAIRLNEVGLLPEESRRAFVDKVIAYALDGEDLYAIESKRIQSVLTAEELSDFRARIRNELLPRLTDVRNDWEFNYDSDHEAEGHMQPLLDSFSALKKEFADEPEILRAIDQQIELGKEWMYDHMSDDSERWSSARSYGNVSSQVHKSFQGRGIFDDIDE